MVSRGEIQKRQAVPQHFLSKILRLLVAAKVLESVPGAHGGFRLCRPAAQISIRQVYESVEGHLLLTDCAERREGVCAFMAVCSQRNVWRGAQRVLVEYLDHVSVGEIADEEGLMFRLGRLSRKRVSRP